MDEIDDRIQHVLMAEDDDEDFDLLSDAINEMFIEVSLTRAGNGDVLMKMLHREIPDMLFLDILMPCRDGKDCLREIRADKKFDNLPIIVYTSLKDMETEEFCYRKGTNLFVYKPHSFSELTRVVQRIFSLNWKKVHYFPKRSDFVLNP
jgi:CheY-like chemotaxis protein